MNRMTTFNRCVGCAIGVILLGAFPVLAHVDTVVLKNNKVEIKITPEMGGRVLAFSVPDKPNVLMSNVENDTKPLEDISHDTEFIEYFGHINWVSPQSQWWMRQELDSVKKAQGASWPPDPFLIYGKTAVVEKKKNALLLAGIESPVSGVQFLKKFKLVKNRPGAVDLHVTAINTRDTEISWGIWFNTRVKPVAQVYVPIDKKQDVRIDNYNPEFNIPADFNVTDEFFSYKHGVLPTANKNVRSKAFIQPAQGWMAAFVEGQVFIIQFPLQAAKKIHPQQGQIEIYHAYNGHHKNGGMLEMELHAPYITLKPGEKMQAGERWTVLPYRGSNTRGDQITFLNRLMNKKIINEIEK